MSRFRAGLSRFGVMIAVAACAPIVPRASYAQQDNREQTFRFDIAAASLGRVLTNFSEITGIQLVYTSELVKGKESPGLSGTYSAQDALSSLLDGLGIAAKFTSPTTVALVPASSNSTRVLGPVRVEGAATSAVNGTNGSRDVTATEGTGSYTTGAMTIGSKTPMSIKDLPQSVSVLTAQRLEEQNIADFTDALAQAPGISLVQGSSSLENIFYSRGFEITSIQIDGGAPLTTAFGLLGSIGFYPQIDMAQYDHVEVLRGASGLLNGYGNPGGTVNLVRKKPLDHAQVTLETQAGSWSTYRAVLDATAPLALDGKLRGRAVLSYQDNEYFYETAQDNRTTLYGILEYDLTRSTLVSVGASHARQQSTPWYVGLPRFQSGDDLELPRDTCLCFPWNSWNFETAEIFGALEQRIGNDWTARLNVTHSTQESTRKVGYSEGTVNPLTNAGPVLAGTFVDNASDQLSAEVTMAGAFDLFGQRQGITLGINHVDADGGGFTQYLAPIAGTAAAPYQPYSGGPIYCDSATPPCPVGSVRLSGPPINVFNFNPNDLRYSEPRDPLPTRRFPENGQTQSGAYLNLRLTAFDRWTLITGLRYSRYEYDTASERLCTSIPVSGVPSANNCVGRQIGDSYFPSGATYTDNDFTWPPAISLSYAATDAMTAYIGYTDIYLSQGGSLDRDLRPVDPITGSNIELGWKWQPRGGRLNATLAIYRIEREGFAIQDVNSYGRKADGSVDLNYTVDNFGNRYPLGQVDRGHKCCYVTDFDITERSQGTDVEVSGELLAGWQVSANYTYNENEYRGADLALYSDSPEGTPLVTRQPEHLFKAWTSYRFSNEGWARGLSVSGGVNGQSKTYRAGTACVQLLPPDALGASRCAPDQNIPYSYTIPTYAIWAARADYRLSDRWALAINVQNLFDKRYYKTTGSSASGNWYGEPRNVTISLRGKW